MLCTLQTSRDLRRYTCKVNARYNNLQLIASRFWPECICTRAVIEYLDKLHGGMHGAPAGCDTGRNTRYRTTHEQCL